MHMKLKEFAAAGILAIVLFCVSFWMSAFLINEGRVLVRGISGRKSTFSTNHLTIKAPLELVSCPHCSHPDFFQYLVFRVLILLTPRQSPKTDSDFSQKVWNQDYSGVYPDGYLDSQIPLCHEWSLIEVAIGELSKTPIPARLWRWRTHSCII